MRTQRPMRPSTLINASTLAHRCRYGWGRPSHWSAPIPGSDAANTLHPSRPLMRTAESDYAFKASISRAYEGYRREAARIDKDLEARLLASALTRLDEVPLRVVETVTHRSPWHELMASDTVRDALKSVPGFANSISDMAKSGLASLTKQPSSSVPAASIVNTPPPTA